MSDKTVNRFMATTMENKVTSGQLTAMRTTANRNFVDHEDLCEKVRGCKPEQLSRKAASGFIDFLKSNSAKVVMGEIRRQQQLAKDKETPADIAA